MRELVERAMAGDHDAFATLAQRVVTRLYGVARLIVRDSDRAKDATQEALVAAWRELPTLRDPERFDAWVGRLLVRVCYREAQGAATPHHRTQRAGHRRQHGRPRGRPRGRGHRS
jgi:RNA polymerase sigma-70 factor (ECF subfamily)